MSIYRQSVQDYIRVCEALFNTDKLQIWMNSLRANSLTGMEEEREYGHSENMSLRRVIMLNSKPWVARSIRLGAPLF